MAEIDRGKNEMREQVEKRTGSELIRELIKAIPVTEKEALEIRLSQCNRKNLCEAVMTIRTANASKKSLNSASIVPMTVHQMLGIEDLIDKAYAKTSDDELGPLPRQKSTSEEVHEEKTNSTQNIDTSQLMMRLLIEMQEDRKRDKERREIDLQQQREQRERFTTREGTKRERSRNA